MEVFASFVNVAYLGLANHFSLFFSLAKMRAKVWRARTSTSLFNTQIYAQGMEKVYRKIWAGYSAGQPFDHITEL